MLRWIRGWLENRRQRVSINGAKSEWGLVTCWVPQGSVLGPLLFIMYKNYLDLDTDNTKSKFADNTEIGRIKKTLKVIE